MDAKSIHTLELGKILERLSRFTAFSASTALALALTPATELEEVRRRQQETTEARKLLTVKPDLTIGGARDVRASAQSAAIGAVLEAGQHLLGRPQHRGGITGVPEDELVVVVGAWIAVIEHREASGHVDGPGCSAAGEPPLEGERAAELRRHRGPP